MGCWRNRKSQIDGNDLDIGEIEGMRMRSWGGRAYVEMLHLTLSEAHLVASLSVADIVFFLWYQPTWCCPYVSARLRV